MNKNKLLTQLNKANEQILMEFHDLMKGVIYNRYNKSKGFQFALLSKNLNSLYPLISIVNEEILTEFLKKQTPQNSLEPNNSTGHNIS